MAKTAGYWDKIYVEVGRGYRQRRIVSVPFIMAEDRATIDTESHLLADVIRNTTIQKSAFIAPCSGQVLKVSINATTYPTNAAGDYTVDVYKAVIGDTDLSVLSAVIAIDNETDETAVHGTVLSTASSTFIEGQLIYVQLAMSNNACTAKTDGAVATIEWRPTEA